MASGGDTEMVTGPSGEGSSAGASSSVLSKRPKRFEIKKWNAVALWAWGMWRRTRCLICQVLCTSRVLRTAVLR